MEFNSLGLSSPILKAIAAQKYGKPTPIQQQAIPAVLSGKDVMGAAQTGTGKTAGFVLPILQTLSGGNTVKGNHVRTLILTPTRELAAQVGDSVSTYGANLPLRSTVVFGGVKINPQMMKLRKGVDILVATPGRLLDLYNQNAVKFNQLEVLVLDEADRMLDMGFIHDIKKVIALLPKQRQTLMFSATFSDDIRRLAKTLVKNPEEISVTPRNTTVEKIEQWIHPVDKKRKSALLIKLIKDQNWYQVLVFTRTKHGANRLAKQLEECGIKASAIHGNKSQNQRTRALAEFKQNKTQVLVATDIAARGLDIHQLPHVVNFDLPNVPEDYVHRIGRTGRAGSGGEAISLVSADEAEQLGDIEFLLKKHLPRSLIDGFEPNHDVPESNLNRKKSVRKPKKLKSDQSKSANPRNAGSGGRGNSSVPGKSNKKKTNKKSVWSSGNTRSSKNKRPPARRDKNSGSAQPRKSANSKT